MSKDKQDHAATNSAAPDQRATETIEELREEQHRLRAIIDNAVDAIITIDSKGIVEEFNPAAERLFGYGAEEVTGNNVRMLMPPPFASEHDGYLASYLATGEARVIGIGREVEGRHKNGTQFPMHLAVSGLTRNGETMFVGTVRDLTDIKETREALLREHALSEGIVTTAQAIILRLDRAGRIVSFNPYMARLCGYELEEVAGKDWFETFVPDRVHGELKTVFAKAIGGQRTRGRISALLTKSGEERLIEWYDEELHIHGEPFTLLAIGHDVTAQHQLQREFLQAQKMEAIGRLSGGVAHDFNNLLAGIIGGLRIASHDLDVDHPARKTLEEVQSEVERGAAITRRLLDFSRIHQPAPRLVCLNDIIQSSDKIIRRLLGEDIEIVVDCLDPRCKVFADPGQIEQAVLNLAINARDAMPKGGKLEITCDVTHLTPDDIEHMSTTLAPGVYATLSVSDSGCGMDEETRKQAVTPFFTTKGPGLGTGLGLSSVASMTEACGGALSLKSALGEGTVVRLALPWVEEGVVEIAPKAPEPDSVPRVSGDVTILVVEDEKLVRLGIVHELEEQGYTVHTAVDAEDALEQMERVGDTIALLLSDVVLPGMSGPDLAARVAEDHPDLRVLFMSAFPSAELVAQGRIQPDTVTLEKPFDSETVRRRVLEALA